MAYRYGDRYQGLLFPPSVEELVPEEAPVRAYDAFVEALDLPALGFKIERCKVGNPQYHPAAMLKLLLYGYSYGVRSSRKLEREIHNNITFIWLVGGLKPDHKTIAQFRRKNLKPLKQVLRQCARLCLQLGLMEGNTLFVDGTKIRANASIKHTWNQKRCEKALAKVEKRIAEILAECESIDSREEGRPSLVRMHEELRDKQALQSKIKKIVAQLQMQDDEKAQTNTSDSECQPMKSIQGSHAAYNVQSVVEEKHGLIVHAEAVNEATDHHQFARQVQKANETLGRDYKTACADSGYADVDEWEVIDHKNIRVVVPSQKQAQKHKTDAPFDTSQFTYDREKDGYMCPAGHVLRFSYASRARQSNVYRGGAACRQCQHFGRCTDQARGRSIWRKFNADVQEKLHAQYETPESQAVYALRKQKVELPFGHIKRNLKMDGFLMRGLEGVNAETSVLASCFNLVRMITLLGVGGLIAQLTG